MPSYPHRPGWQTAPASCPGSLTPTASSFVQVCPCGRDRCLVCTHIIEGPPGLSRVAAKPETSPRGPTCLNHGTQRRPASQPPIPFRGATRRVRSGSRIVRAVRASVQHSGQLAPHLNPIPCCSLGTCDRRQHTEQGPDDDRLAPPGRRGDGRKNAQPPGRIPAAVVGSALEQRGTTARKRPWTSRARSCRSD
jgi:hypothetical protein